MTVPGGYCGRALRIELTTGAAHEETLPDTVLRRLVGGVGLGAWLLHRHGPPGVDPFAPEAPLVIALSPLVGTPLTTSAKFAVLAKSPLTDRICDALASDRFAIELKRAGMDALVLHGACAEWSVLVIDEDGPRLEPAADLVGLSSAAAEDSIRARLGGRFRFFGIGPAGECGVRYATISGDGRHAGRGGLGAVLGAKRLKGVAVRGSGAVTVHDPERVLALAKDLSERSLGPATAKYRELGTVANLLAMNRLSALPTRNFRQGSFEHAEAVSGEAFQASREVRKHCASCTIGCEHVFRSKGGKSVRLEYEGLFALGPLCGISDRDAILEAGALCDDLGIDVISAGGTVAFAMECSERGLLADLPWGADVPKFGDAAGLLRILAQIGCREGAGAVLADGSRRAAAVVGGGAERFAAHVKGLELPGYEPRALQTMALGLAVSTRGADHNRSGAYEEDFRPGVDRTSADAAKGPAAVRTEVRAAVMDSLILCKFLRGAFKDLLAEGAAMLSAVTGWDMDAAELEAVGHRVVTLRRLYNQREGWTRSEDTLPERFLSEALADGTPGGITLSRAGLDRMIASYYADHGWTDDGRVPRARVDALDLADLVTDQGSPRMTSTVPSPAETTVKTVTLTIDGREVTVPEGTSVWEAARGMGIDVPVLCHDPKLEPVGVCRMCIVEVEGARTLQASCVRPCDAGMNVQTDSEAVRRNRRVLTELMMADQPGDSDRDATTGDDELFALARELGADRNRFAEGNGRPTDPSSAVIAVNHQACILCDRCIRACDDIQSNHVIGRTGKGYGTKISFDLDNPMGDSSCVECGECAAACPTGALINKPVTVPIRPAAELTQVDSVCPYCGVGCAVTLNVDTAANKVVYSDGRTPSSTEGRLCVKGRYGFDYASHPHRLTKPLIRKDAAYPKRPLTGDMSGDDDGTREGRDLFEYDKALAAFREATWDEAFDLIAEKMLAIRDTHGPNALAGFGSAKCSNEEAYLFQKMVRTVFQTNNVDHCTRLCHASSVAALLETIGSGAVTTVYRDIENSDVALVTGTNTTSNHPVAATFFKEAARKGTKLIVVDPRRPDLADHAHEYVRIRSGSDVSFYNGIMNVILEEGLQDDEYVAQFTLNFESLVEVVQRYTPEVTSKICGIAPERIRSIARTIGGAKAMLVFWGMGISQHVHGTDNARSLINLVLLTGNMGRPGTGLHPLRGQNNVQGASDAGLIPMVYPDYASVADPAHRERFEAAWGQTLDPEPGLTVVEIAHAAEDGSLKGLYVMGENPFLSDPNVRRARDAFCALDFLVVQDIFLTETAEVADVILPASSYFEKTGTYTNSDRRVQLGQAALDMPGEARQDWEILCEVMKRMGRPQSFDTIEDVFVEFSDLTENYNGLRYRHLRGRGKLWPCPDPENSEGTVVLFGDGFPTESGRGTFAPAEVIPPAELPDDEYPFVLNTGRMLQHWHTGSMTRRAKMLDAIAPEAVCELHPDDLAERSIEPGSMVRLSSRRGSIRVKVNASRKTSRGGVFIPFHFREAAANLLTNDALDPAGKIPEFKFAAIRIEQA